MLGGVLLYIGQAGEGAALFPPLSKGRWRVFAPEGFN
jgi:hypothetical protein